MALLDDFTTGPERFSVPPATNTTRFQTGSMPGGVRGTFLNNAYSPRGTEALLEVGGGHLNLTLGVEQYVRLEVFYGARQDGVHPLGLNLHDGGADRIRTTISNLAGSVVNFNIVAFSARGWTINGSNVGAGQVDLPFAGFSGPGGQDFTNVDYIIFIFQSNYSLTLDRIETAGSAGPTADEQLIIDRTNQERQMAYPPCPPVQLDSNLMRIARAHSLDMASHHPGLRDGPPPAGRCRHPGHYGSDGKLGTKAGGQCVVEGGVEKDVGPEIPGRITEAMAPSSGFEGENVASGQATANEAFERWFNETPPNDGHRRNILNCNFKFVGVGIAKAPDGTPYYTQDFFG